MPEDVELAVARLLAAQSNVASRRQLDALGFDRRRIATRLRAGLYQEPAPGVIAASVRPLTWVQRLWVATLIGSGAVASHRSAARLHRLDGCLHDDTVEVSTTSTRRRRAAGVVAHAVSALDPADVTTVDGVAVTGLARTLADLGSVCPRDRVQQALDDVLRRRVSVRWLQTTAERLHRPGQRGTGTLLALLAEHERQGVLPDSWFERLVERALGGAALPAVVRQHVVRDGAGRFVARLDLAMPSIRLGIEAHSRQFHTGAVRERADEDRDLRLAAAGWEVLYLGWQYTRRPTALAQAVRRVVEARTRT